MGARACGVLAVGFVHVDIVLGAVRYRKKMKRTATGVRVCPAREGFAPRGAGGADAEVDHVRTGYPLVAGRHVGGG